jgi:Tfp pilus assembly protein PilE
VKQHRKIEQGFSAVELLITLFIATAFVAAGYELYSAIISDGGQARARTKASDIAYAALRQYSSQAQSPCAVISPTPAPTIPAGSNLSNASITISITCPYGVSSTTSKIEASVKYNNPQEEVVHALFVNE